MIVSRTFMPFLAGLSVAALAAAASSPAPPKGSPEQIRTITDMRNVGTAMWQWYKSEVAPHRSEETHKKAVAHAEQPQNMQDIPVISRADLAKILVPKYIAAIPEKDGWGHPYELHLNASDPNAVTVFGLRSGGADGKFSSDVYEIGSFPQADAKQDVVWVDGYFVRWPEAKP